MNIGDLIESAIWLDGTETEDQRKAFEFAVSQTITDLCMQHGFTHDPVKFVEKTPYDERVPPVPAHIENNADDLSRICLLVAEARITGVYVHTESLLTTNLEPIDLQRLRVITRNAALKRHPVPLTDAECDQIINELGPEAAIDALEKQTVVSRFH